MIQSVQDALLGQDRRDVPNGGNVGGVGFGEGGFDCCRSYIRSLVVRWEMSLAFASVDPLHSGKARSLGYFRQRY